jgi:uncharacterized membrane protein
MRKEILLAGIGWMLAGIISLAVWAIGLPLGRGSALLPIGLLVIIIGLLLLLLNKRLGRTIAAFEVRSAHRLQK